MTPLIAKLSSFTQFTTAETRYLETLGTPIREVEPQTTLYRQGERHEEVYLVTSGWGYSSKMLPHGRRQIIDFAVAGDFVGLRSMVMRTTDHSFATISRCRFCQLRRDEIRDIFEKQPGIATAFLWALARSETSMVERLVSMGRRTALASMAHLLIDLLHRLRLAGIGAGDQFECPLRQDHLADALGLTSVHVNRVLRQLREREILTFRNQRVVVHDIDRLASLAGYDPDYLDTPVAGPYPNGPVAVARMA